MQYISSHYYRRKLEFLKDQFLMGLMANEAGHKLMVTIQEYQALKGMELKSYLMELVKNACTETKDR